MSATSAEEAAKAAAAAEAARRKAAAELQRHAQAVLGLAARR